MKFVVLFLSVIMLMALNAGAKKHVLYVGTYTQGVTDGIFIYSFNDQSGKLVNKKMPVVIENPSFLTVSGNKKFLYAVSEVADPAKNGGGSVSAFRIDKKGSLALLNQEWTHGAHPCFVNLSPDSKRLVTANYTGGSLSLFDVLPDGSLSKMVQRIKHEGSSVFKGRQGEPHAHSARFDATGKFMYAADLGIDELKIYQHAPAGKELIPYSQPYVKMAKGAGPRHFVISSDGNFIYVINELNSTITVLIKYGGVWKEIQTIKTLPQDFKGESWCADIHLSADGRFVYGSNRGHNSIAVFTRHKVSGKLEMIQNISVEGNWPRNFTIDPSGKFLLVANEKSNDITVFRIDETTGKLKYTGVKVQHQAPVCLQFLK